MKPPITVKVKTDNLHSCELQIAGTDGVAVAVKVPSNGNVYQGLHAAQSGLERVINDILAAHGIVPDEPLDATDTPEPVAEDEPTATAKAPKPRAPKKTT